MPIAPLKFSTMIAADSAAMLGCWKPSQTNAKIGKHLQDAAEPQGRHQRQRAGDRPAEEAADQQGGETEPFDDCGIGRLVIAEREDKRRRHGAGEGVQSL